ncbi:3-hydroxyacyl-CoA dehydrogenase [Flagelloscypha sp. PMI_526]|nr:3-hydroxyacyl-CoA dehydrogenase [Flagelloscypha sp. PMI_526]
MCSRSSGLGLATVQDLVKAGAWVANLDLQPPSDWLEAEPSTSRVLYIKTNIGVPKEVEHAVAESMQWINQTGKTLGGVINCAGMGRNELVGTLPVHRFFPNLDDLCHSQMVNAKGKEHSLDVWDQIIAVNLTGTFNLTRLVLKHLANVPRDESEDGDGERGVVILTSSSTAYEGPPGQVAYAASKGAISSMALPMARDLSRHGIRVVSIAPSSFHTPLLGRLSEKVHKGLMKDGILFPKRYGLPREFAATVRWILETGYVNGEDYRLSGGGRVPAWL